MAVGATYRWENGMVTTFNEHGEQIPELQGVASPILVEAIKACSTPETKWIGWGEDGPAVWPGGL